MELIPIGEAAHQLGLKTSALRYYDERGLVPVRTRRGGGRVYGRDELRRLAFLKIAKHLGIPLETAAAILDARSQRWRDTVRQQIAELDNLIEQAHGAQTFLTHALNCPHTHPTRDCPSLTSALDELVAGATTMEQLRHDFG
ncbi:MerR family transcriptional regulator [Rhodococcus opacus]|nr:MerR family transcriptional regulator [Rhodococcus opacus]